MTNINIVNLRESEQNRDEWRIAIQTEVVENQEKNIDEAKSRSQEKLETENKMCGNVKVVVGQITVGEDNTFGLR